MKKMIYVVLATLLACGFAIASTNSSSQGASQSQSVQSSIPPGTIIPVRLSSSLHSKKSKPGQIVTAKVAQDVPLYNGETIKAGTRVQGEVLAVTPAQNSQPATIALRFDKIDIDSQMTPISTDLRALASPEEIDAAQVPSEGPDRGQSSPSNWTTVQVGQHDAVYRGGGPVASGAETVGTPVYGNAWGVLARVSSSPGEPCRGPVAGNDNPQALWLFSHDACGVYGYDFTVAHAGRKTGRIVLESRSGNLNVRGGSGLLLRVTGDVDASQNEVTSK